MSGEPKRRSLHQSQERPVLSVFSPQERRNLLEQLSPQMTLGEFYNAYVLPCCRRSKGNDHKTITIDRTALGYWEQFTRDPGLEDIDEVDMADFVCGRSAMIVDRGRRKGQVVSANTVCKDLRHLQYIIDRAGPRSRKRRNAARLIPEPPGFDRPPACDRGEPELIPLDEIGRWLTACRHADRPMKCRIKPVEFWRALVVFVYNAGFRIDTVMQLTWSMLDQSGWMDVPPEIFKGKRHGGKFYINSAAREVIEPLRRYRYERIFPWYVWPGGKSNLQKSRRELWAIAGIRRPGVGFHGLRKSLLTWLGGKNRLIADFVAGHVRGNDILANHYVDHRQIVPELLEQVPQPIWSDKGDYRQRTLPGFDLA